MATKKKLTKTTNLIKEFRNELKNKTGHARIYRYKIFLQDRKNKHILMKNITLLENKNYRNKINSKKYKILSVTKKWIGNKNID
jgi:hypothetical protein